MKRIKMLFAIAAGIVLSSAVMAQSEFASNLIGVGVVVTDLDRSLEFYTDVLGMKVVEEFDVDEEFGRVSGLTGGIPFNVKVLKLEDTPSANQWKLMSFGNGPGHPSPGYIQEDTGPQYITIMVKSLAPFLERIKKHNVKLLGDTPVSLGTDQHFALIQDPDGTFIELIGPLR